jgi:hypothetical protein
MTAIPETRYATVGNDRVTYQVLGEGPRDLVFTMGQWGHADLIWEEPASARFLRRLASFEDRGTHELKGVPDEWRIYAVSERQ